MQGCPRMVGDDVVGLKRKLRAHNVAVLVWLRLRLLAEAGGFPNGGL